MPIVENPMGQKGKVQLYLPVVEGSMRLMAITSPRTSQLQTGIYFEVETPEGRRVVWKMKTPGVGEKIFVRPEAYEEQAYRQLRQQEQQLGKVYVTNGQQTPQPKKEKEGSDAGAEAAIEQI